ncbi:MAG TPA: response regulator [Spirochaetota bacterium]|nr:response regulator [Spirochaetota bacterium]
MDCNYDSLICGIIIMDSSYNVLIYNDRSSQITEYSIHEIKESSLEILNSHFYDKLHNNIIEKNYGPIEDDLYIVTKNKKEKFVKRNIEFIIKNEHLEKIVISFIDITKYKEIEQDYFFYQKNLSLSEVTKTISLEYNNLLAAILGFSSFLKNMVNPSDDMYKYLEIIETSANQASGLTNQLMSFAGNSYFKQSYVNFNKLVHQNVELFKKTVGSNIKIDYNNSIEDLYIYWDESQLNQIVINTILNAKEAIEQKKIQGLIEIEVYHDNNYLKYIIKDNGIGIAPEQKDEIFKPYFTTKDVSKHRGLGLSVTEGIVKNMGGSIDCHLNNKTTFTITLPYQIVDINKITMLDLYGNGEKILVIDDVDSMRNLATILLKQKNYVPFVCSNGKDGLEILKKENIDLVLLDVIMPDMGGEEVFYEIKKINPTIPIILLTGYTEEKLVQKLVKTDGAGIIVKPFETYDFFNKIHTELFKKMA